MQLIRGPGPLLSTAFAAALVVLLGASAIAAQPAGAGPGAMGPRGPASVGVVTLALDIVPVTTTVPGRAVASAEVDIRPRVSGMISEITYQPGRPLSAGDLLFRIESETYEAEVASAQASVALAEAAEITAQATVRRYSALEGTGVTTETLETARVDALQRTADLSAARAALQVAQLDLARTEIVSPIDGFASVAGVSVGALVTANQTEALTTVTRVDPVFVDIQESSRRIGEMWTRVNAGSVSPGERLDIRLQLETGEVYPGEGEMVSPGLSVSASTGMATFRLRFDNAERRIMPGQFLRVDITLGSMEAILVPQMATSRAANGALTAFIAVDGVAEQRLLTEQGSYGNAWIVTAGVEAGESLIVDGLTMLRDGAEVNPLAVVISDEGVISRADGSSDAFVRLPDGPPSGAAPPGDQDAAPSADTPEAGR